ncbi:hypothetical protein EYF80_002658 [Liparis tanakae]|uniref:Uncharacterized protein n=1 Tax=Liparis tanakae TaxID=230148 RepID=A0A4Z2JAX5_9TELE|nr:hypothetical protein EYF80_002658 [Liparis tanakae]
MADIFPLVHQRAEYVKERGATGVRMERCTRGECVATALCGVTDVQNGSFLMDCARGAPPCSIPTDPGSRDDELPQNHRRGQRLSSSFSTRRRYRWCVV